MMGLRNIRAVPAMLAALAALAIGVLVGATPSRADRPLAGEFLVADTHGQAFCVTPEALRQYLIATIEHQPYPSLAFSKLCTIMPYGSRVTVLQDLPPFGSRMHMVRARAATPLQQVDGFTYSVGLYDARRFQPFNSLGEYFPRVP